MNNFKTCQFCNHTSNDICEFRMWQRCDKQDKPIQDYLITCKGTACFKKIDDDELLFIEVPWSQGGPGRFMLVCGDCSYRENYTCKHPDLKANGGEGLEVILSQTFLSQIRICMSDGTSYQPGPPATSCVGNPRK